MRPKQPSAAPSSGRGPAGTAGRLALAGLAAIFITVPSLPATAVKNCSNPPTGLTPITDLATGEYQGFQGGLYPGGSNEVPNDHLAVGLAEAAQVVPRGVDGEPDSSGLIGLISVGVSNTRSEFQQFLHDLRDRPDISPNVRVVNGAQGGRSLEVWASGPASPVWRNLADELEQQNVSPGQVQAAWVKLPSEDRGTRDLAAADAEIDLMTIVLNALREEYPNLRLAYLSSRIYGGYSGSEPAAYQHGFTTKWLIQDQMDGAPSLSVGGEPIAPWLAWGPYMWADGVTPRDDGLTWECSDFRDDGVHPAGGATEKVSAMLIDFFVSDPTAAPWFLANGTPISVPPTTTPSTAEPPTTAPPTTAPGTTSTVAATSPSVPATATSMPSSTSITTATDQDSGGPNLVWLGGGIALGLALALLISRILPSNRRGDS